MRKSLYRTKTSIRPDWASMIVRLRQRLDLSQTAFGHEVHSSAMGVSRWERGAQEPPSHAYIELGNLAGDPDCWFFWGRAGLRNEDLMRVVPGLRRRLMKTAAPDFEIVSAGGAGKKSSRGKVQLIAIPLLKVVAASHGEKGDD